jgi:hypothetical protein
MYSILFIVYYFDIIVNEKLREREKKKFIIENQNFDYNQLLLNHIDIYQLNMVLDPLIYIKFDYN